MTAWKIAWKTAWHLGVMLHGNVVRKLGWMALMVLMILMVLVDGRNGMACDKWLDCVAWEPVTTGDGDVSSNGNKKAWDGSSVGFWVGSG